MSDLISRLMEDLISRQAATSIPILPKEHRKVFRDEDDAFETGWNEALACVNRLPSVCLDLSDYCDRLWKLAYERGKAEPKTGEWVEEDEYGDLWICK